MSFLNISHINLDNRNPICYIRIDNKWGFFMTRIDCIPVELLTDQHLRSNYREITRVSSKARPLKDYGRYKMHKGHMLFFYNKGEWLSKRCDDLYFECIKRGFKVQRKIYRPHPEGLNNDWKPNRVDQTVCLARIAERLREKPNFYKFHREPMSIEKYIDLITDAIEEGLL